MTTAGKEPKEKPPRIPHGGFLVFGGQLQKQNGHHL